MRINTLPSTNFKSGITSEILKAEKKVSPKKVESYLKKSKYADWGAFNKTDFKGNKTIALANRLCAEIFKNLRKIVDNRGWMGDEDLLFPQDIYVFNRDESVFFKERSAFFENTFDLKPIPKKEPFLLGTVFVCNNINSLESLDANIENYYSNNQISSSHFLQPFVHEWLHAMFDKLLYNVAYNRGLWYEKVVANIQSKVLSDTEKEIVANTVGTYPTIAQPSYSELFAESWSKFICESLADDCKTFSKNPLDLLAETPKEFQDILKKTTSVELLKYNIR